jgi:hypothetical protein
MAANAEEADATTACLQTLTTFLQTLKAKNNDAGLAAVEFTFVKGLLQHLQLTLDVPDSMMPAPRVDAPDNSDDESDGAADRDITHQPNLGLVLNMLIHTFNGDTNYPVETFLSDVSRVCRRRRIKGVGKIEIAMGKLRDPALSTIRAMSLGDVTSWSEFKANMLELFADVTDLPTLSLEISKCKQTENESITSFSVRLYNLLLKKSSFCVYADQASFRLAVDAEATANLILGMFNTEMASVVRRTYPKTFKEAVKIAKLEELAKKTKNDNSEMVFKQVKLAVPTRDQIIPDSNNYQQGFVQRNDDRNYQGFPPCHNDQNNYQQGNSNPRYRDPTPIGNRNQQYNGRNYYNDESDSNDSLRGRSRERENSRQRRRPPARSLSAVDTGGSNNCPYVVPCDCQACEHNFSGDFIFPDVQCFDCYNYGHVDRDCIHYKRGWEKPPRDDREHSETDQ